MPFQSNTDELLFFLLSMLWHSITNSCEICYDTLTTSWHLFFCFFLLECLALVNKDQKKKEGIF